MTNPAWWLFRKAFIATGTAVVRGLEKTGELIDQMKPDEQEERGEDDEKSELDGEEDEPEDEEQREDEEEDESRKDSQEDDHEEGWTQENQDAWDKEHGLRLRDQPWWDDDDEEEPEQIAEPEESSENEPEEDDENEVPLGEKVANWAARKIDRGMSRLAMAGLRRIVNTDWSEDDEPEKEAASPEESETEKHESEVHEFWENFDDDRPVRAYESVDDLIHEPEPQSEEEDEEQEEGDEDGCGAEDA